jgi:hypothetical protein
LNGIITRKQLSGAVAKPNSSAPSKAAMATSRPVLTDHHILKQRDFKSFNIKFVVLLQDLVPTEYRVVKEVKVQHLFLHQNQILNYIGFCFCNSSSDRSYTNF